MKTPALLLATIAFLALQTVQAANTCRSIFGDKDNRTALEVLAPDLAPGKRDGLEYVLNMTNLKHLLRAYDAIRAGKVRGDNIFDQFLKALNVRIRFDQEKLDMIPRTGPLVVTSNHPYGGLDGIILMAMVKKVRPDVKFLATAFLTRMPEFADSMISVSFERTEEGKAAREAAFQTAQAHVQNGGALVLFPAGGVSQAPLNNLRKAVDASWKPGAARVLLSSGATSVSMRFTGQNSLWFQLLGHIPGYRPVYLGGEVINKRNREIDLRIGEPIHRNWQSEFATPEALTDFLRNNTDAL